MKRTGIFLLILAIASSIILTAQTQEKRPLTTNDFASWKTIKNPIISNDGKLTAF